MKPFFGRNSLSFLLELFHLGQKNSCVIKFVICSTGQEMLCLWVFPPHMSGTHGRYFFTIQFSLAGCQGPWSELLWLNLLKLLHTHNNDRATFKANFTFYQMLNHQDDPIISKQEKKLLTLLFFSRLKPFDLPVFIHI